MLSGATCRALAIDGTAVFRIVASSASIKKATATSQGSRRLAASVVAVVAGVFAAVIPLGSHALGPNANQVGTDPPVHWS